MITRTFKKSLKTTKGNHKPSINEGQTFPVPHVAHVIYLSKDIENCLPE